jgi:hypothetical protein
MPNSGSAAYPGFWHNLVNGEENSEEGEKFEELDPSGRYGRVGFDCTMDIFPCSTIHFCSCIHQHSHDFGVHICMHIIGHSLDRYQH